MRPLPTHLVVFSSLLLAVVFTAWLGVAGSILTDAAARGVYDFLKDWQSLVGSLIALGAALIAVRPVWKQLGEARWQSMQRSYEQLAARSRHLHQEREALYLLTSAVDLMVNAIASVPDFKPIGGITANTVMQIQGAESYLRDAVEKFKRELGPVWGSASVQQSRSLMLDQALRFCNKLEKLSRRIQIGNMLSDLELTALVSPLVDLKRGVFHAGVSLHSAIDAETARIGPIIAKLEAGLLAEPK